MNKILISNLENTLIPSNTHDCELLYGKNTNEYYIKKIYETFINTLNPYFDDGNELVIIGNLSYHHNNEPNIDITKIHEIFKKYSELINIYIIGEIPEQQKDIANLSNIKHIEKKEQVFNDIDLNKKIYCLGNNSEDIELLKKGLKNNASAGIILHKLLDPNFINRPDYINQLINEKIKYLVEDELSKHHLSNVAKVQLEKRIWMNLSEELKKQLIEQLNIGKITYLDIIKEWYLRKEILYHYQYEDRNNFSMEEINFLLSNTKIYNSFHDFYELTLKK